MFWAYYREAFPRVFFASISWALGAGWLLTLLLAVGVFCASSLFAAYRAQRGKHSWEEAMVAVRNASKDFVLSLFLASSCALLILFFIFFVQDAPAQVEAANTRAKNSEKIATGVTAPAYIFLGKAGFVKIRNAPLFSAQIEIINKGGDVASDLVGKIFDLKGVDMTMEIARPAFVANDISSGGHYVFVSSPPFAISRFESPRFLAIAVSYKDKKLKMLMNKVFYLKFPGIFAGRGLLTLVEPSPEEVGKMKIQLTEELAPYRDVLD